MKDNLEQYELKDMIFSTTRGQMANTEMYDCDYYSWQDKNYDESERFEGEFLSEYSWGEYILGNIITNEEY